jgi:hypothetical protein
VDTVLNRLFLNDGNTIRRVDLSNNAITTLVTLVPNLDASRLVIDVSNNWMYWMENDTTIRKAHLDGSGVTDVATGLAGLTGFDADVANQHLCWIAGGSMYRSNLSGGGLTALFAVGSTARDPVFVPGL